MKKTKIIMGMPVSLEIVDHADAEIFKIIFDYFKSVDEKFSTYKKTSEVSRINSGKVREEDCSLEMREILGLAEQTKRETDGYFDIFRNGEMDPSGIVKGWAVWKASEILKQEGIRNYYIDAGGDVQTNGKRGKWRVGIRNPFNQSEIVKIVKLSGEGIATSGRYIRGDHIYNPFTGGAADEIASLTVIAENVYEADRFATAAFAMGTKGIAFIEKFPGLEGYMISSDAMATMTSGFGKYESN